MIQEFQVENFLSIGERQSVSFVASSDKKNLDNVSVEVKPGLRLLRLLLLYGANASGKSNLLFAIDTLWNMMFYSQYEADNKIPYYFPNEITVGEPTKFSMTFWNNCRKYEYFVEYNDTEILFEKMMYTTNSGVLSLMYERKKGEKIIFGSTLAVKATEKNLLHANTLPNHTLISTLNKLMVDIPALNSLYSYIKNNVHNIKEYRNVIDIAEEASQNAMLKNLILDVLHRADINICDFELVAVGLDGIQRELEKLGIDSMAKTRLLGKLADKNLMFVHNCEKGKFRVDYHRESKGTIAYFLLAKMLFDLRHNEAVCLSDEIEASLHYDLLVHYLKMFLQTDYSSQLVCTTHNIDLLDEEWMIRRDMVYLVDKERDTAESCVSRVSDMGLHKNLSIGNSYRIGKLNAKPLLGSTMLGGYAENYM